MNVETVRSKFQRSPRIPDYASAEQFAKQNGPTHSHPSQRTPKPVTNIQSFYFVPPTEIELSKSSQESSNSPQSNQKMTFGSSNQSTPRQEILKNVALRTNEIPRQVIQQPQHYKPSVSPFGSARDSSSSSGNTFSRSNFYSQNHVRYPETLPPSKLGTRLTSGQRQISQQQPRHNVNNPNDFLPPISQEDKQMPVRTHFKAVLLDDSSIISKPAVKPDSNLWNTSNRQSSTPQFNEGLLLPARRPVRTRPFYRSPLLGRNNLLRQTSNSVTSILPRGNLFSSPSLSRMMNPPPLKQRNRRVNNRGSGKRNKNFRNAMNFNKDMLHGAETRNNVFSLPTASFIRTGQYNAGGHLVTDKSRRKDLPSGNTGHLSTYPTSKRPFASASNLHTPHSTRNRPQIVLNSRPPITSVPSHLRFNNFSPPSSRGGRQNSIFNSPKPSRTPRLNPTQSFQTIVFETPKEDSVPEKQGSSLINSIQEGRGFKSPPRKEKSSRFSHRPTGSHVYGNAKDSFRNADELNGISQPLPHQTLLKSSHNKMAESHVSLLKNLQFGVNGEPLDVWIPMKRDKSE